MGSYVNPTLGPSGRGGPDARVRRSVGLIDRYTRSGSYTPTWTASLSPPSLGDGSIAGTWDLLGGTRCYFGIQLVFGSTTSGGVGNFAISLPFAAANKMQQVVTVWAVVSDGAAYGGVGLIQQNATAVLPYLPVGHTDTSLAQTRNTVTGGVGEGFPFVAGDYPYKANSRLVISGVYEIAGDGRI